MPHGTVVASKGVDIYNIGNDVSIVEMLNKMLLLISMLQKCNGHFVYNLFVYML